VAALEGYDPAHCGEIVEVASGLRGAPMSDVVSPAR
jgi:hypothetical protein